MKNDQFWSIGNNAVIAMGIVLIVFLLMYIAYKLSQKKQ